MYRFVRNAALAAVALAFATPAHAQFSVHPVNVEMKPASQPASATIHIRNDGKESLRLGLSSQDFEQTVSGEHVFALTGTMATTSCEKRIRVIPSDVVVPAGDTRTFRVEMDPGEKTCWAVVWVTNAAPTTRTGGAVIGYRIGVKVYGSTPAAKATGEIIRAEMLDPDSAGKPPAMSVGMVNQGDAVMRPVGQVEISDASGKVIQTLPVSGFSVLPKHERDVRIEMPRGLPKGEYAAMAVLDYGGDYAMAARLTFIVR